MQVLWVRSLHLKVHNFPEHTKKFRCPDGSTFYSKSKDLRVKTKSSCHLTSDCWKRADGCSAPGQFLTSIVNGRFEVIIVNLYSYEQKLKLTSISINIHSELKVHSRLGFRVGHSN